MTKSDEVILKVENLSKQYRLGLVGTGTLSHDLNRWWHRVRGKEDPYLKIGETNDRSQKGESEYVWALKDINFEVKRGEVLGIIGKNGAGKSTLLKILSKVTSPTTGSVKTRGRIASLLEVGTGFHGEMTGRENIYLNGAILGMTKKEIASKIDEIIDFSGCARYIDTPVKRYSSGMTVRLAFAVAAFLEPDILIVDEVLAVGDAEFQKKAIGKMQDISSGEGRTVLFVSHNMAAITRLCPNCILLQNGKITLNDTTKTVVQQYFQKSLVQNGSYHWKKDEVKNDVFRLKHFFSHNLNYDMKSNFEISEEFGVSLKFDLLESMPNLRIAINVYNEEDQNLFDSHENYEVEFEKRNSGSYISTVWFPKDFFNTGIIKIGLAVLSHSPFKIFYHERQILILNLSEIKLTRTRGLHNQKIPGLIRPLLKWDFNKE